MESYLWHFKDLFIYYNISGTLPAQFYFLNSPAPENVQHQIRPNRDKAFFSPIKTIKALKA